MPDVIADLKAEVDHLDTLLARLSEAEWRAQTQFKQWAVFDHVGHLCISDRTALHALTEPETFATEAAAQMQAPPQPVDWKGVSVPRLGARDGAEMRTLWRDAASSVAAGLAALPPKARVPWYGPAMSAPSFATARLMETWAHGETIRDALGVSDPGSNRLRHICDLGYRTRGFNRMIHRLAPDDRPVRLELTAPSGELWIWGEADAPDRITGPARDFARTVCQCRNIADTDLQVTGEAASQWMAVAQCFVGGASTPPSPGTRQIQEPAP